MDAATPGIGTSDAATAGGHPTDAATPGDGTSDAAPAGGHPTDAATPGDGTAGAATAGGATAGGGSTGTAVAGSPSVQRLAGRRLLITGASAGIGEVTARAVVAAGGRVALLARSEVPLRALAAELEGVAVPADVVDPHAARAAVDAAAGALGGLDGVVNAAGVARPGPIATTSPADWQRTFDVNVRGLLHVTQAALPHLAAAGSADAAADVVNVSSMSGRRVGSPSMGVYAASKAAVHALSEALRREVAEAGVRVSVIAPGFVRTGIFDGQDSDAAQRLGQKGQELGLDPRHVADRIVEVLAAPPGLVHVEVAFTSIEQ